VIASLLELWEYRRWSALLWVAVWLALVGLFVVAGLQARQAFATARVPLIAIGALVLCSTIAAVVVPLLPRGSARRRGRIGESDVVMQSSLGEQLRRQKTEQR